jgi:hypothetical protein
MKVCRRQCGRNPFAALRIALEVVIERIGNPVRTFARCGVAGYLTRLACKENTALLLGLSEREDRQAVRVARVVGRPQSLIVLSSLLVAESADPVAAVGAAADTRVRILRRSQSNRAPDVTSGESVRTSYPACRCGWYGPFAASID